MKLSSERKTFCFYGNSINENLWWGQFQEGKRKIDYKTLFALYEFEGGKVGGICFMSCFSVLHLNSFNTEIVGIILLKNIFEQNCWMFYRGFGIDVECKGVVYKSKNYYKGSISKYKSLFE